MSRCFLFPVTLISSNSLIRTAWSLLSGIAVCMDGIENCGLMNIMNNSPNWDGVYPILHNAGETCTSRSRFNHSFIDWLDPICLQAAFHFFRCSIRIIWHIRFVYMLVSYIKETTLIRLGNATDLAPNISLRTNIWSNGRSEVQNIIKERVGWNRYFRTALGNDSLFQNHSLFVSHTVCFCSDVVQLLFHFRSR